MNTRVSLVDLIDFELRAIESGLELITKKPIYCNKATLTFNIDDLLSNSVKLTANIHASLRAFNLRESEISSLAPLLYLAGFKILDMIVEFLLGIDPYRKEDRKGFECKASKLLKLQPTYVYDEKVLNWIALIYKELINFRNSASHKKTLVNEVTAQNVVEFLEAIYWLANLESPDPIKQARSFFETSRNSIEMVHTSKANKTYERQFVIVQVVSHEQSIGKEKLHQLIKSRLTLLYPDIIFDFFIEY